MRICTEAKKTEAPSRRRPVFSWIHFYPLPSVTGGQETRVLWSPHSSQSLRTQPRTPALEAVPRGSVSPGQAQERSSVRPHGRREREHFASADPCAIARLDTATPSSVTSPPADAAACWPCPAHPRRTEGETEAPRHSCRRSGDGLGPGSGLHAPDTDSVTTGLYGRAFTMKTSPPSSRFLFISKKPSGGCI